MSKNQLQEYLQARGEDPQFALTYESTQGDNWDSTVSYRGEIIGSGSAAKKKEAERLAAVEGLDVLENGKTAKAQEIAALVETKEGQEALNTIRGIKWNAPGCQQVQGMIYMLDGGKPNCSFDNTHGEWFEEMGLLLRYDDVIYVKDRWGGETPKNKKEVTLTNLGTAVMSAFQKELNAA